MLRVLVLLAASLGALPAHAQDRILLRDRLVGFVRQFDNTEFGARIRIVAWQTVLMGLASDLDIQVNPSLSKMGKYSPPNARAAGGIMGFSFRNSLLEVKALQPADRVPVWTADDVTVWHEFLHHLVYRAGGLPCGLDEAYAELNEMRVNWLNQVRRLVDTPARGEIGHYELRRRWKQLEQQYISRLGGVFDWSDPDGTCGQKDGHYQIDQLKIAELDATFSIEVNLADVRAAYPRLRSTPAQIGGQWCRQHREGHAAQKEVTIAQTEDGIDFGAAFTDRSGTEGDFVDATTLVLKRPGPGDVTYTARGTLAGAEIRWNNGDIWKRLGAGESCVSETLVNWAGTYVSGTAKYTISSDTATLLHATFIWIGPGDMKPRPHRSESAWSNCVKVKINEVECAYAGRYTDADKDFDRSGTLKATLSGNDLRVIETENEPKATWRVPAYASSIHKGKVWDVVYRRTACRDPNTPASANALSDRC